MKLYKSVSILWLILLFQSTFAQDVDYSNIRISVITCGSGEDLYTLFGHSALRVINPSKSTDLVYNWGTFDFGENTAAAKVKFAVGFLRGKLPYALSVSRINRFLREYQYYQRPVSEQVINLSETNKKQILELLDVNQQGQNRFYKYDFYYDNCVTRIRDIIENELGKISYPDLNESPKSFRDLLHENLTDHPWTKFGMDIVLGTQSDKIADMREQMFLPAYFQTYLADSKFGNQNVVSESKTILTFDSVDSKKGWLTPLVLFVGLLVLELVLFFFFYISGDRGILKFLDALWFLSLSFASIFFIFMWFGTDHTVCKNNWSLLWASPFAILYFVKNTGLKKFGFLLTIFFSLFVLLGWTYIPQQLPTEVMPLVLISLLKSVRSLGFVKWVDSFKKIPKLTAAILFMVVGLHGQGKIGGITMVSPPNAFTTDPMQEVTKVNANWVALVPYAFSRPGKPRVIFGSNQQWWGERLEGIEESLRLAKKNGLKIMIKPQVWMPGGWVGEMDFNAEDDWLIWEEEYRKYIMTYVELAVKEEVEMICIGTEFRISVRKRESYWRDLIREVRKVYKGKITYSSNWDSYEKVPIWDVLDFIGISAYFPLSDMDTPPTILLSYRWGKYVKKLRKMSERHKKPILFTEYGYLSVDGAAGKTWELEKKVRSLDINEQAQANGYAALLNSFWNQEFWAGGFLWKWFPEGHGHEGYPERDYTPQNKKAQKVLQEWYGR